MIPEEILQIYLGKKYKDLFEDISKIKFNDYFKPDTGLGNYLDSKSIDPSQKKFGENSSTIKNKINFCEDIIKLMNDNSEWKLPKETKEICSKIYTHILEGRN